MQPLLTFGDLVLDVIARVDSELDRDTDTPGEVRSAPGGSAANFAVWHARLGGPTRFAGRVGDDLLGRALRTDMQAEGIDAHIALDPVHPTAVLVLFSQGEQRHMMVPAGANHHLQPADVPAELIRSAGWLHVTGYSYFWAETARTAAHAVALAREASIPISFDPSSAGLARRRGLAIPEGVQVLLANREEALLLSGCRSPEAAARKLAKDIALVAVKLGGEGALICQGGAGGTTGGEPVHLPAADPGGPVLDTTGAGDAWGAAFVLALRLGRSPLEAAAAANRLAARVVAQVGARPQVAIEPDLFLPDH